MNKKTVFIALSLFLITLLALSVQADVVQSIRDSFQTGVLSFIFKDFADSLQAGGTLGIVGARILFALLIFSVLFGASEFALKAYARNIRIMITMLVAFISAFAIPGAAIQTVSLMWGGLFYLLMVMVPVIVAFFLIFGVFKGTQRTDYFIKFFIAAVMTYVTTALSGSFGGIWGTTVTIWTSLWEGLDSLVTLVGMVFLGMSLYYLYKLVFPTGVVEPEIPEGTKKAIARWYKRKGRADFNDEPKILDDISQMIKDHKPWSSMKKTFKRSDKILKRLNDVIMLSYKEVEGIEDGTVKTNAKRDITGMEAEMKTIKDYLREVEKNVSAARPDYAVAEAKLNEAIISHRTLMKLEIQFLKKIGVTF